MKAVQINAYGGIDVLEINETAPKPTPSGEQLLVEVHAVSINPFDWKMREGYAKAPQLFPITLGGDFAGITLDSAELVYGSALVFNGGSGAFAEFASVNTANFAPSPNSLTFEETAALPLVGVSAIQALEDEIKLQKGQKILIHGGAGGIGSISIQLAKSIGAHVATTVSSNDKEYVKELGADEIIDYKTEKFDEKLRDFDAVFDTVGGDTADRSFLVLKKGGILVSMLGQPNPELAQKHDVSAVGIGTSVDAKHLSRLTELVESEKVKPQVDKVFPLDQVKEAFEYQEKESPRGKVVLRIKE